MPQKAAKKAFSLICNKNSICNLKTWLTTIDITLRKCMNKLKIDEAEFWQKNKNSQPQPKFTGF